MNGPVDWKTLTDDALEEVRIFARSASDDKVIYDAAGYLEILKRQHRKRFQYQSDPHYEEEQAPRLAVARYKRALAAGHSFSRPSACQWCSCSVWQPRVVLLFQPPMA